MNRIGPSSIVVREETTRCRTPAPPPTGPGNESPGQTLKIQPGNPTNHTNRSSLDVKSHDLDQQNEITAMVKVWVRHGGF